MNSQTRKQPSSWAIALAKQVDAAIDHEPTGWGMVSYYEAAAIIEEAFERRFSSDESSGYSAG